MQFIIDFTSFYYRSKFLLDSGRLTKLTLDCDVVSQFAGDYRETLHEEVKRIGENEFNIGYVYYPLREVENLRKTLSKNFSEIKFHVCFDSKSVKKDKVSSYKSGRKTKMVGMDFVNIEILKNIFSSIGYNVYKEEGYEADDLIFTLKNKIRNVSGDEKIMIYSNDLDLACLIDETCNLIFRRTKGKDPLTVINKDNYEEILGDVFQCYMPFNTILLYKAICGDRSDNIGGVRGLGKSYFERVVNFAKDNFNLSEMAEIKNVRIILKALFYSDQRKLKEAQESLELLEMLNVDGLELGDKQFDSKSAVEVFNKLRMKSLVNNIA